MKFFAMSGFIKNSVNNQSRGSGIQKKKNPNRDVHLKWKQPISIIVRVSIV